MLIKISHLSDGRKCQLIQYIRPFTYKTTMLILLIHTHCKVYMQAYDQTKPLQPNNKIYLNLYNTIILSKKDIRRI